MRKRRTKQQMVDFRRDKYFDLVYKLEESSKINCSVEDFNILTEAWRAAAKECNLIFRKGITYTGNNRKKFPLIYLPTGVELWWNDVGDFHIVFTEGLWVEAHANWDPKGKAKNRGYKISTVDRHKDRIGCLNLVEQVREIVKDHTKSIDSMALVNLMDTYGHMLDKKLSLGNIMYSYSGWHRGPKGKLWQYVFSDDTILNDEYDNPFRVLQSSEIFNSPLSGWLIVSTLFSISKPLMSDAGLPTKFLVYFYTKDSTDYEQSFYWYRHWTRYFCNPNTNKYTKQDEWFERKSLDKILSPILHHNFPILFRKMNPDSKNYNPIFAYLPFGKQEAEMMLKATCLPILLAPIDIPKGKTFEQCLTLKIRLRSQDKVFNRRNSILRQQLFEFYSGFLVYLNENIKTHVLAIKRFYKQALADLNCTLEDASVQATQIACLLTAVYLAEKYIEDKCERANIFEAGSAFWTVKHMLLSFASKQTATLTVFANFLQTLIDHSQCQFPLLLQDESYLYLSFKEYWSVFERYCQSQDIPIQESEKGFRRKYLAADYLKPQYAAKPGAYPRYDYRKLIGAEKKVVLVVKKEILKQSRVFEKAEK